MYLNQILPLPMTMMKLRKRIRTITQLPLHPHPHPLPHLPRLLKEKKKKDELEWKLVPKDYLPQKFENLELASCAEVMMDYKKADGYWAKQGTGKKKIGEISKLLIL